MRPALSQFIIYNGYPLSVVVAVSLHCLILALLLFVQGNNRVEALELVQPTIVKALFIDENPQVVNARNLERQRLERLEQQRQERERELERQAEAARRQAEAETEAERQRQLERERTQLLERQELERLQAEQERLEQQRLQRERLEEEQRRQRELAEAERQRQGRLRQQEAQQSQQLEAARTEFELVQSATALIQQFVQENWSRPPSARNGMRAVLRIAMLPTGEVTDVSIVESSNDPAFDRSAERAIYSAEPFTELQELPIRVFNANFRSLTLIFQPEDLLN